MRTEYKKCRTLADINNDPRVYEIWQEGDIPERSWWCLLNEGFKHDQLTAIHEATIKGICGRLNHPSLWSTE